MRSETKEVEGVAEGSAIQLSSGSQVGPSRDVEYASEITRELGLQAMNRTDLMKARQAVGNRLVGARWTEHDIEADPVWAGLDALTTLEDAKLNRLLRKHEVWPWLSSYKGLGGVHVARLIAGIAHPWRFPGQMCTAGHFLVPRYAVDSPCPRTVVVESVGVLPDAAGNDVADSTACSGVMLAPRPGTGVRSLWHYLGLHAVNGKSPRFKRGQQGDWSPHLRAAVLMPDAGIAAMIVRNRTPKYRDVYDATKARLIRERGLVGEQVVSGLLDGESTPIRLGWADATARKVAAKAFVGDLLTEWKGITKP
jgi:hypothetical protein